MIFLYIVARLRTADLQQINDIDKRMDKLDISVADKLDKVEHQRNLDRIDREILALRDDAKEGQAEIRSDIRNLQSELGAELRSIREAIQKQ